MHSEKHHFHNQFYELRDSVESVTALSKLIPIDDETHQLVKMCARRLEAAFAQFYPILSAAEDWENLRSTIQRVDDQSRH